MAQHHKAAILPAIGSQLVVGDRPTPTPKGNQALVKVTAAGINPLDWKIQSFGVFVTEFPIVLGVDGTGIVEAVGPEVNGFKPGDKIFFQGHYASDEGLFQQYALVNTDFASKVPDNISDDQAATLPVTTLTAVFGLFQKSGVEFPKNGPTASGKGVFIIGGSSSVGQYAIQIARIAGFSPIVVTSSAQHTEYLKALGATHVFDRDVDTKTVQAAFQTPVSFVFDTISVASTQSFAFDVLTTPSVVPAANLSILLPLEDSVKSKNLDEKVTVHRVFAQPYLFKELSLPFWAIVAEWIKEGKLVPNRVQVVPGGLSGVSKGLDLSRKGVSGVKLVVHPQD